MIAEIREFLREATLGSILESLKESFYESLIWWGEGAEKLATFDILSFDIGQIMVTIFFMYAGFTSREAKDKWEYFNHEVDNVSKALESEQETKDMIALYKFGYEQFSETTDKDLSDEDLLKTLKKRFKRKKPKIILYVNQFFHATIFYWIAVFIYIMTNYAT